MSAPRMPTREDYLALGVSAEILDNPPSRSGALPPAPKLRPANPNRQARYAELLKKRQEKIERLRIERIEAERDRVFALVEQAAPYLDAVALQARSGWMPSFKLKLIYWVVRTGPNPDNSFQALSSIERLLDIARERYREGLDPNPWLGMPE